MSTQKGLRTEGGLLMVYRGGKKDPVPMTCMEMPTINKDGRQFTRICGDFCPFFSEPEPMMGKSKLKLSMDKVVPNGQVIINLCRRPVIFKEFEDKRI